MSFGGAVAAMNHSIKNNRALAKRRNIYKENTFMPQWDKSRKFIFKKVPSYGLAENRKKNLTFVRREKYKSRIGLLIASFILLTFLIVVFKYVF